MKKGGPLEFIADKFYLPTCTEQPDGEGTKLLKDFQLWELVNIVPEVVLDIPDRLREKFFITSTFLQNALEKYLIQTVSKDSDIFNEFEVDFKLNQMAYFTSATKHYSWPKGAGKAIRHRKFRFFFFINFIQTAVTGIGSQNIIDVEVDNDARLEVADLEKHLQACLDSKRPVYAVVAIIGSTEQGACDPLDKIVELRQKVRFLCYSPIYFVLANVFFFSFVAKASVLSFMLTRLGVPTFPPRLFRKGCQFLEVSFQLYH